MTAPAKVRAVLLDVDGTLIDSVDAHADSWTRILQKFGHPVRYEDVRRQIGKGSDQFLKVFLTPAEIEAESKDMEQQRKELFLAEYLPKVQPFPRVREFVQHLQAKGLHVILASSAAGDELEKYKRVAHLEDIIQRATTKDDAERSKPHPDIFEAALAQLGDVPREQAVVIGDTPWDAEAAQKAGLRCLGVLSGGFAENWLRQSGCTAIYRDVADLLTHFDSSPLA